MLAILVIGLWFGWWGQMITQYGVHVADRLSIWRLLTQNGVHDPNRVSMWRPSIYYGIFQLGDWELLRLVVGVSTTMPGSALVVSWRRRRSSRLAAASVRLAMLGLSIVCLAVVVGSCQATYELYRY